MRQLDTIPIPSFTLVLNQAYNPARPLACHSSVAEICYPPTDAPLTRIPEDPLMTTVDYRYESLPVFPLMSWDDPPVIEEAAVILQAAMEGRQNIGDRPVMKRRLRFSALVIDLAVMLRDKCKRILPAKKQVTTRRALEVPMDLLD